MEVLYARLGGLLRNRISSGEWKPGEFLPSEAKLCHEYRVSRATVRCALAQLAREGLVIRQLGRGTRVQEPPRELPFRILTAIDPAADQELGLHRTLVQEARELASDDLARRLGVTVGSRIRIVKNLYGTPPDPPLLLDILHVPLRIDPGPSDTQAGDLALQMALTLKAECALISVRPEPAPAEIARLLSIERATPLLRLDFILCDDTGRPVAYQMRYSAGPAAVFGYAARLKRPALAPSSPDTAIRSTAAAAGLARPQP